MSSISDCSFDDRLKWSKQKKRAREIKIRLFFVCVSFVVLCDDAFLSLKPTATTATRTTAEPADPAMALSSSSQTQIYLMDLFPFAFAYRRLCLSQVDLLQNPNRDRYLTGFSLLFCVCVCLFFFLQLAGEKESAIRIESNHAEWSATIKWMSERALGTINARSSAIRSNFLARIH